MKRTNLSGQEIANDLQKKILSGALPLKSKLPTEEQLGAEYRVSRVLVREALQVLKARGLIQSQRGSGSYVSEQVEISSLNQSMRLYFALCQETSSYLEWMDLRILLEPFCIEKIIQENRPKAIEAVKRALLKMRKHQRDLLNFGEADIEFHLALIEESEHRLIGQLLLGALEEVGFKFAKETYRDASETKKNLTDHEAILKAMESGNSVTAQKLLRDHLIESKRHLQEMISK